MRRLLTLLLLLVTSVAQADSPPAGSPTALNQRPRLIVTQANRAAIRAYIHANYSTTFQNFLTMLGTFPVGETAADGSPDVADEKTVENIWGPINYSFPVALGVTELKALGYTFPAALDTPAELCAKTYENLTTDITDGTATGKCTVSSPCLDPLQRAAAGVMMDSNSTWLSTYVIHYPNINHQAVALAYDWCAEEFTATQRQIIFAAYWTRYGLKWGPPKNINTIAPWDESSGLFTSGRFALDATDLLMALAAWGDTDIDATQRQSYYDAFSTVWLTRLMWEVDQLYAMGFGYMPGLDYYGYGHSPFYPAIAAIDTALGTTYASKPWFKDAGAGMAAWRFPEHLDTRTSGCDTDGTSGCTMSAEAWGWNEYTWGTDGLGKATQMTTGFLRLLGYSTEAAQARWFFEHGTNQASSLATYTTTHWANDVYMKFLFGPDGVTASAPTAQHVVMGPGYHIYRTTYDQSDSYVVMSAPLLFGGSHDKQWLGTFGLHKYGPLIVPGGNIRNGECRDYATTTVSQYRNNQIYLNNVGIHSDASDAVMAWDTLGTVPTEWSSRGYSSAGYDFGTSKTSDGTDYHYVQYDQSVMWPTQATLMQREFTYLRGTTDHEYLVILDRAHVKEVADDPVWKMWVPHQPACVDVACTNPRAGKWSTTGKVLSLTNQHGPIHTHNGNVSGGQAFDYPAVHGKFFFKSVLPTTGQVQILGDNGTYTLQFQSGNDDGTTRTLTSPCRSPYEEFYGWGRIEVRLPSPQLANTFLNVIQFGDANSLASMSDVQQAQAWGDREWIVAHIADADQDRLVAYATDERDVSAHFGYQYPQTTRTSAHLLTNLSPGQTYYTAVGRQWALVGPVSVIALPFGLLPFLRRRTVLIVLVLVAGVIGGRWLAVQPVMLAVEVSTSPNGGMPRVADAAGVISFEVTR